MIEANNLSFCYSKRKLLFDNLSFKQKNGHITGLLGKNGAGKSTFLKLMAGLLYPAQGSIMVNGHVPHKRSPDFLTNIFLVPEAPFFPALTIDSYADVLAPLYKKFDRNKMDWILSEFELSGDQKLNAISYGQRKKFIIAFALSTNCGLLLLDEPTNGLDIPSKQVFRKVLVGSVDEDQSVVISTHQVKDIETVIDRVVILEGGEIVFEKDAAAIMEKLRFQKSPTIEGSPEILYAEKCPEGYNTLVYGSSQGETEMDIELLFNAIMNKTEITL